MGNQGEDRRRELLICLTDNASNPRMLWQIVSCSALAKDTFETWPRGLLLSAMRGLPAGIHQLAADYVSLVSTGQPCQRAQNGFGDDESLLPEVIQDPLHALKALASVNEAIEVLTASDMWKASKHLAISTGSGSQTQRLEIALWRLTVLWALDKVLPDVAIRVIEYQRHGSFLWNLSHDGLTDMARVYDDLSYLIEQAYPEKLAGEFANAYCHYRPRIDYRSRLCRCIQHCACADLSHQLGIIRLAEYTIRRFVDGQLARGLPFLYSLHIRVTGGLPLPSVVANTGWQSFPDYFGTIMFSHWRYEPNIFRSRRTGLFEHKHKAAYRLTATKEKHKVSLLFGSRSTYFSQRLMHIDEEIVCQNKDIPFYSGEDVWDECMAEIYGADLEDSLWIFDGFTDVLDLEESSWMFSEDCSEEK